MIKSKPGKSRKARAPEEGTRERIVVATISCVEKYGLEGVTIRNIAKQAGVNSAAINYYFRAKDKLLDEVMKTTAMHSIGDLEEIVKAEGDVAVTLSNVLDYILEGALRFPNVTKAHFFGPAKLGAYKPFFLSRFNVILTRLADKVRASHPVENDKEMVLKLVEAASAVMLPALIPDAFKDFAGINFADTTTRKNYIALIIDQLLGRQS